MEGCTTSTPVVQMVVVRGHLIDHTAIAVDAIVCVAAETTFVSSVVIACSIAVRLNNQSIDATAVLPVEGATAVTLDPAVSVVVVPNSM